MPYLVHMIHENPYSSSKPVTMANHQFQPLKIFPNSNIFGPLGRSTGAPRRQSRPPQAAGFEAGSPAAPSAQSLQVAAGPHGLGQWSPSPGVARDLMARRFTGPGRQSLGNAARMTSFAPLQFGGCSAPLHKKVRLLDEPHRLAAGVVPLGIANTTLDEPKRKVSSGKLVISFPVGVSASNRLSARRPQHAKKSRAAGATAALTERPVTDLLLLEWNRAPCEPGVSPAPSAPETPGLSPNDGARVDDVTASAQEPHTTTAAADASAVALPTAPTPQPAATTSTPGPSGARWIHPVCYHNLPCSCRPLSRPEMLPPPQTPSTIRLRLPNAQYSQSPSTVSRHGVPNVGTPPRLSRQSQRCQQSRVTLRSGRDERRA